MPAASLTVDRLSRRFGTRWALAHVRFSLQSGESLMLIGANGSGKTTLLRCLATALRPHDGTITFNERALWENRYELRPSIAFLTHATRLYEDLTARENLVAWAAMGGITAHADDLLARVGLSAAGDRVVRTFSAGMKRRLALALCLLKRPALCLLDEPFSALDPAGRAIVADVVRELRRDGATIILSTHHAALGAPLCDKAIRLSEGQIVWRGAPSAPEASAGEA